MPHLEKIKSSLVNLLHDRPLEADTFPEDQVDHRIAEGTAAADRADTVHSPAGPSPEDTVLHRLAAADDHKEADRLGCTAVDHSCHHTAAAVEEDAVDTLDHCRRSSRRLIPAVDYNLDCSPGCSLDRGLGLAAGGFAAGSYRTDLARHIDCHIGRRTGHLAAGLLGRGIGSFWL